MAEPGLMPAHSEAQQEKEEVLQHEVFDIVEQLEELAKFFNKKRRSAKSRNGHINRELMESAEGFHEKLKEAKEGLRKNSTVIGIIGTTGAGKSSLINALLEEEALLPTSCRGACTAVPIEIAYNFSEDDDAEYRAEVEFLSRAAWESEVSGFLKSVEKMEFYENMRMKEALMEAQIIVSRLKAVCPSFNFTSKNSKSAKKALLGDKITSLLGTKLPLQHSSAHEFTRLLLPYVSSEPTNSGPAQKSEVWPLVKSIRLFTKSSILENGAVLVDLPGLGDANQARGAVAEKYLHRCNALFVVAPMNRAMDDKVARNLMGRNFRRQLLMEGGYGCVTFIASKADEISCTEMRSAPGMGDRLKGLEDKKAALKKEFESLKKQRTQNGVDAKETARQIRKLQASLNGMESMGTGSGSTPSTNNERALVRTSGGVKIRARTTDDSSQSLNSRIRRLLGDVPSGSSSSSTSTALVRCNSRFSSSSTETVEALRKLFVKQETLRINEKDLRRRYKFCQRRLEKNEKQTFLSAIQFRNDFCKVRVKEDFAQGLGDFEYEAEDEEEEEGVKTEKKNDSAFKHDSNFVTSLRDNLPVFCVSSRGYQTLSGRMMEDGVKGYSHASQTEIPALQKHCKRLATLQFERDSEKFIKSMEQYLGKLRTWSTPPMELSSGQKRAQREAMSKTISGTIENLDESFVNSFGKGVAEMRELLQHDLVEHFNPAIQAAIEESTHVITMLGPKSKKPKSTANPNPEDGPLIPAESDPMAASSWHWKTLRSICKKSGDHKTENNVSVNINEILCAPMLNRLPGRWSELFKSKVPGIIGGLQTEVGKLLSKAEAEILETVEPVRLGKTNIDSIKRWLESAEKNEIQQRIDNLRNDSARFQRDLSGSFQNALKASMKEFYEKGYSINGIGTERKLREYLDAGLREKVPEALRFAGDSVEKELSKMVKHIEATLTSGRVHAIAELEQNFSKLDGQKNRELPDPEVERMKEELFALLPDLEKGLDDHKDVVRQVVASSKLQAEDASKSGGYESDDAVSASSDMEFDWDSD